MDFLSQNTCQSQIRHKKIMHFLKSNIILPNFSLLCPLWIHDLFNWCYPENMIYLVTDKPGADEVRAACKAQVGNLCYSEKKLQDNQYKSGYSFFWSKYCHIARKIGFQLVFQKLWSSITSPIENRGYHSFVFRCRNTDEAPFGIFKIHVHWLVEYGLFFISSLFITEYTKYQLIVVEYTVKQSSYCKLVIFTQ